LNVDFGAGFRYVLELSDRSPADALDANAAASAE
jgi:hypothetical protein